MMNRQIFYRCGQLLLILLIVIGLSVTIFWQPVDSSEIEDTEAVSVQTIASPTPAATLPPTLAGRPTELPATVLPTLTPSPGITTAGSIDRPLTVRPIPIASTSLQVTEPNRMTTERAMLSNPLPALTVDIYPPKTLTMLSQTITKSPYSKITPTAILPARQRSLLVDQDVQIMYVYENGIEVRQILVSTGAPVRNRFTPSWQGTVGESWGGGSIGDEGFYTDHMWYLFDGAEGSILIHSIPYTKVGEEKIYDQPEALGVYPTSHGCVRISPDDAIWLMAWDPVNVPIKITRWTGHSFP